MNCGAFEGYAFEGECIFDENKATRSEGNGIVGKIVKNTASEEEKDGALYQVWDCIDTKYYEPKGKYPVSNSERRNKLQEMMNTYEVWCEDQNITPKIKLVPRHENVTMEEATLIFEDYVRSGFEGAILKDADAGWAAVDKPSSCVKMKRCDPADLEVVGVYEGTGKAKGSLGGFYLESSDGIIKTGCGSGLSDEQRNLFWEDNNLVVGKVVEIEYEQVSECSKTGQKSMTFPIFVKVRDDKTEADCYDEIKNKVRIK